MTDVPVYRLYEIVFVPAIDAMEGNRGRMISQGGHGFVHAIFDALDRFPEDVAAYRAGIAYKITLACHSEDDLRALVDRYRPICGVTLVEEKGRRHGKPDNEAAKGVTGAGIGPIRLDLIGKDIKTLDSFK